jgi:hypothetical protein
LAGKIGFCSGDENKKNSNSDATRLYLFERLLRELEPFFVDFLGNSFLFFFFLLSFNDF